MMNSFHDFWRKGFVSREEFLFLFATLCRFSYNNTIKDFAGGNVQLEWFVYAEQLWPHTEVKIILPYDMNEGFDTTPMFEAMKLRQIDSDEATNIMQTTIILQKIFTPKELLKGMQAMIAWGMSYSKRGGLSLVQKSVPHKQNDAQQFIGKIVAYQPTD